MIIDLIKTREFVSKVNALEKFKDHQIYIIGDDEDSPGRCIYAVQDRNTWLSLCVHPLNKEILKMEISMSRYDEGFELCFESDNLDDFFIILKTMSTTHIDW